MIYQEFGAGHFSFQLSTHNTYDRLEVDKIPEKTINKDTKTSDSFRGSSTNFNAVDRYIMNATK